MSVDYAAKVAAGIKLLDEQGPQDWRSKIDLGSLRLESCDVCVLGQVFGVYDNGLDALDIDTYDAKKYGFNTDYSMQELTAAWKDALGKNNVLVEKGDVYTDKPGCCAVKVVGTSMVNIDGEMVTAYIVVSGSVNNGVFTKHSGVQPEVYLKSQFEENGGYYNTKLESFTFKKGQLVTNDTGKIYFVISEYEVREVKDQGMALLTSSVDRKGLREVRTYNGKLFTDTMK